MDQDTLDAHSKEFASLSNDKKLDTVFALAEDSLEDAEDEAVYIRLVQDHFSQKHSKTDALRAIFFQKTANDVGNAFVQAADTDAQINALIDHRANMTQKQRVMLIEKLDDYEEMHRYINSIGEREIVEPKELEALASKADEIDHTIGPLIVEENHAVYLESLSQKIMNSVRTRYPEDMDDVRDILGMEHNRRAGTHKTYSTMSYDQAKKNYASDLKNMEIGKVEI